MTMYLVLCQGVGILSLRVPHVMRCTHFGSQICEIYGWGYILIYISAYIYIYIYIYMENALLMLTSRIEDRLPLINTKILSLRLMLK